MASPELSRRVDRQAEDLQAIGDTVLDIKATVDRHSRELVGIRRVQTEHSQQLAALRSDVTEIRSDVTGLRSELGEVRSGLSEVRSDLSEVLTLLRDQSR
ncbi:hypothetical protein [Herbihabitans rhizosphaerae]|uniref:hypothetical protein n=1 Tax=Herbihabitans rhizosphaerae TaxID=1872711 RepID=UPI00102CDB35|nr:hypothetical protein [Herbihabitans rhizosphaerae]